MKELISLQNPLIKHLVKLRQNSNYRYDHNAIILEGAKVIAEASEFLTYKTIITSSPELLPQNIRAEEMILTTPAIIQKISGLQSSDGIVAEATMPKLSNLQGKRYVIALDRINDPGNLGTILRTALALGWEGVFFLDESCDPYNEKSIRASRGAIFKLAMARGTWDDLQKIIKQNKLSPFVADIQGIPFQQLLQPENILLVLGNEAQGPSSKTLSLCTSITIPMPGKMESLNVSVAAGILLYSLRQKAG